MRVVILEDDPIQAELVCDQLVLCFRDIECSILVSENEFVEQLPKIRGSPPTAMVIDMFVSAPGGDYARSGLRCIQAILSSPELCSVPVIIRSALASSEVRRLIGDTPANIAIVKKSDENWTDALRSLLLVTSPKEFSRPLPKVFIVHGHDDEAKEVVARFIEKLGGHSIILHEKANSGETVIEKFEKHSDTSFAIILITPDDIGGKTANALKARARQNVIFEMGFFYSKLGRHRVCSLLKGDVEFPSDVFGVANIEMDKLGAWRLALVRELKAAKLSLDFDRAFF
jgi:CheY-like chemotaxis protein